MADLRVSANEKGALSSSVKIRDEDHEHDQPKLAGNEARGRGRLVPLTERTQKITFAEMRREVAVECYFTNAAEGLSMEGIAAVNVGLSSS